MTLDQSAQLAVKIVAIKEQLSALASTDTRGTTDDEEANQMIAGLRIQLADIDLQLFGLYRFLESRVPQYVRRPAFITAEDLDV